jgi:hypothetical protein
LPSAEEELRDAVRDASDGGGSWLTIGTIPGISWQAAQQRFRGPAPDPLRTRTEPVRSERFELSLDGT